MAQQRRYLITSVVSAPAFDGVTLFTGGWSPSEGVGTYSTKNQKFNVATTTTRVGRFSPAQLGSTKNPARIVRVYSNGPIVSGDQYLVRSSSNSALGQPVSIVRETARVLGTSLVDAAPLLVGPTDDLCITFAGDGTAASLHMLVDDLSEEEWAVINAAILGNAGQTPVFETRTVEAPATLASWTGTLYVDAISETAGAAITLPPLTDVAIGARLVLFRGTDTAGRWFSISPDGADTINESTDSIRLIGAGEGVVLERTGAGWQAAATADEQTAVAVTNSATLGVPYRPRTKIEWTINTVTARELTLPPLASVAVDQEFVVTLRSISGTSAGYIIPTVGETLDGLTNKPVALVRSGDTALIRRVPSGWASVTNGVDVDSDVLSVAADPALGASGGWRNVRSYLCTYAGVGNFTLPTAPLVGTELIVVQRNATAVTLQAGGNTIIAAGVAAATLALAINAPVRLKYFTGFWLAV